LSYTLRIPATALWGLVLCLTEMDPFCTPEAMDKTHRRQMDRCDEGTLLPRSPQAR